MAITRRELLGRGSLLAALAVMPTSLLAGEATKLAANSPLLTKADFEALKGSVFQVTSGKVRQSMTLVSVEDVAKPEEPNLASFAVRPSSVPAIRTLTTFAVRFYGGSKPLPQGTYTFEHEKLGTFSLFIVPTGNSDLFYTATFNRI